MNITVIKRDGRREPFSISKAHRVVVAAGLTEAQAKKLITNLKLWVIALNSSEVTSLQIRDKVIELLKETDTYTANMYSWYQKTKDKHKTS